MSNAKDAQNLADRMDIERMIAATRQNIATLTEQAAGVSGGATEEFIANRISDQEALLARLQADLKALDGKA